MRGSPDHTMASKGQVDYEGYPYNAMAPGHRLVNRSPDNPLISEDHLKGFQEYNCNQCTLGLYNLLFVQAKEALAQGDKEKFDILLRRPIECFTEEWIVSNRVGFYPMIQSTCEGFSMSRFPVSDCAMKLHMQGGD